MTTEEQIIEIMTRYGVPEWVEDSRGQHTRLDVLVGNIMYAERYDCKEDAWGAGYLEGYEDRKSEES